MAPSTHDVIPIRETQNYWGLHPHENVTIGTGGRVVFRTAIGFHDVAAVATEEEWEACDVSSAEVWVDTMGEVKLDGVGNVTKEEPFYFLTYAAETPGTYYILCSVAAGGHCKTGQKIVLTVTDDPSDEEVTVMGAAVPFWTVGVGYADMTIDLGDSLRFVSDNQGYHDVALLNASMCGASNNYECCTSNQIGPAVDEVLYSESDFVAEQEYTWTPDTAGEYEFVCTVSSGLHCAFGQRFHLTVNDAVGGGNMTQSPTAAPTFSPTSNPTGDPTSDAIGAADLVGSPFLVAALLFAMLF